MWRKLRPTPATVIACIALAVSLGGTAWAATKITGKMVQDNSLTSADIRDGTLLRKDFKPGELIAGPAGRDGRDGLPGATGAKGDPGTGEQPAPLTQRGAATFAGISGTAQVLSTSFGVINTGQGSTVQDFTFTKRNDATSSALAKAAATGTHFQTAQITVFKEGGSDPAATYTLTDLTVSSYTVGNELETVSLTAAKVNATLFTASGEQTWCYDFKNHLNCV